MQQLMLLESKYRDSFHERIVQLISILKISMNKKVNLQHNETSEASLNIGMKLINKVFVSSKEWARKFAQKQNQHQSPKDKKRLSKVGQLMSNNILKIHSNRQVCGLCLLQKDNSEMDTLCKCNHKYCYSCLNSYTIIKINDLLPVKCPQIECKQTMILTSNVYRYLPDSVKLQYLQNKHAFKINKQDWINKCERCFQPRHEGQCQIPLSPELIQQSFKFRLCPYCNIQIRITSGKKRVTCTSCAKSICYLCGVSWSDDHECKDKNTIRQLQKLQGFKREECCQCSQCCQCCQVNCENACFGCRNCCCRSFVGCKQQDFCCETLFHYEDPSVSCCIWNVVSIPVRLLITLFVFFVVSIILGLFSIVIVLWLTLCFFGGFFGIGIQLLCEAQCPIMVLYIIGFPFVGFYGFGVLLCETWPEIYGILSQFCENVCCLLTDLWIKMSPRRCQY